MMLEQYSDVLTVLEVAEILKIGRNTTYELVRSGQIKSIRIGRQIRIPKTALQNFLNASLPYTAKRV